LYEKFFISADAPHANKAAAAKVMILQIDLRMSYSFLFLIFNILSICRVNCKIPRYDKTSFFLDIIQRLYILMKKESETDEYFNCEYFVPEKSPVGD